MNEEVKNIAEKIRVASDIPEEENFGSVVAILMIISIILTLVRVIQECNKNKLSEFSSDNDRYAFYCSEIREYSKKRTLFTRIRIRHVLKRNMSAQQYSKYAIPLVNAILDTGSDIAQSDIISLVEASNV